MMMRLIQLLIKFNSLFTCLLKSQVGNYKDSARERTQREKQVKIRTNALEKERNVQLQLIYSHSALNRKH